MFAKYHTEIAPFTLMTFEQLKAEGAAAAEYQEKVRNSFLQWSTREWNLFMSVATRKLKILRCAWVAKSNGWV